MTNGNVLTIALGGFGLGLGAALLIALLAGRQAFAFLATFNTWVLRISTAVVAALSLALIVSASDGGPRAAMTVASAEPHTTSGAAAPGSAESMEAATQVLAARLAAKGGSDADWALLAQSYDFLGRADEAKLAREHKVSAQRSLRDAMAATAPVRPSASMPARMPQAAATDGKSTLLLAQAEEHRRKREFKQALDAYRSVIAAGGMTADAWADYADALASSSPGGNLSGEPAKAIEQALALDPQHAKALWLKASLAHEEHRYQDALATWRTLLALMPAGSSDAKIIEANIAEAQRLAGQKG
jgi:cytochrome c-type biogenesis protein CcmH/NrfG